MTESITPPSPERIAALQFIRDVSRQMFDVGRRWVDDEHALGFNRVSIGDTLTKLGTKPGATVTSEYELASRLSEVLGINCTYIHNQGYVIEGKESLDKLANAGIPAIADLGYGEKQRTRV